ncbi:MAG: hypothetical protein NTV94_01505, partial [Planctomycetota bacterium]|nr:hypothetical protein [Planctomycetota bacterium]
MNISVAGPDASKDAPGFRISALACAAALLMAGGSAAHASGPQLTFAGRIDERSPSLPPPWNGLRVGDSWELTICLDTSVPDLCSLPDRGCYPAGTALQLRIGGVDQAIVGPASAQITIIDSAPPRGDAMLVAVELPGNIRCTLNLTDRTAQAFESTLLPECSAIAEPALWTDTLFSFVTPGPGATRGHLTRVICTPRLACGP